MDNFLPRYLFSMAMNPAILRISSGSEAGSVLGRLLTCVIDTFHDAPRRMGKWIDLAKCGFPRPRRRIAFWQWGIKDVSASPAEASPKRLLLAIRKATNLQN